MSGDGEPRLKTERLLLRRWCKEDREPFAAMNRDPAVMEHFPALLSKAESDAFVDRIDACFEHRGYGLWAVESPKVAPFMGFVGLWPVDFEADFAPAVEIGWRLGRSFWGVGFATEAAQAATAFAFERLDLPELVSFTAAGNLRSRRVMERLDMQRDPAEDFEHPELPAGDALRLHVLCRLDRARWRQLHRAQRAT